MPGLFPFGESNRLYLSIIRELLNLCKVYKKYKKNKKNVFMETLKWKLNKQHNIHSSIDCTDICIWFDKISQLKKTRV